MKPPVVVAALIAAGAGCVVTDSQLRATSANTCIRKNCMSEVDAVGYQQCEAACRDTYGPPPVQVRTLDGVSPY
jgi:hypothetical protein